jgi:hypothetical protein
MAEPNPPTTTAVKRSWIRVLLLSLVSLGLYQAYWFYVTRQQVDNELGEARTIKQSPLLQLFAPAIIILVAFPLMLVLVGFLLIPVAIAIAIYIQYALIKDMSAAAEKIGSAEISVPLIVILQIFTGLGSLVAQDGWNKYWDKKTNGKATDAKYTGGEIAVVAAGIGLFVLYIVLIVVLSIFGNSASDRLNDFDSGYSRYSN